MKMSKHAEKRCQMRGIPYDCQEIILRHGSPVRRTGGATAFYMSERDRLAAVAECRSLIKALERSRNTEIVVADDGTCITAYKSTSRFQR